VSKGGAVRTYNPKAAEMAQEAVAWTIKAALRTLMDDDAHTFGVRARFVSENATRRDVDNMLKLVMDAATGIVWRDDCQVSEIHATVERLSLNAKSEMVFYTTGTVAKRTADCQTCGKKMRTFPSWRSIKRYCSEACRESTFKRETIPCTGCQRPFLRATYATRGRPYCSSECKYRLGSRLATCSHCRRDFRVAQSKRQAAADFCTRGCAIAYHRDHPPKIAVGTCLDCGGATSRKEYARCRACKIELAPAGTSNYWTRTP